MITLHPIKVGVIFCTTVARLIRRLIGILKHRKSVSYVLNCCVYYGSVNIFEHKRNIDFKFRGLFFSAIYRNVIRVKIGSI